MTSIQQHVVIPSDHKLHIDLELPMELPVGEAEITVWIESVQHPNKTKAIECLRAISNMGGIRNITDPAEWQREVRQDRGLPREE